MDDGGRKRAFERLEGGRPGGGHLERGSMRQDDERE
jgi:hypothetical protein